MNYAMLIWNNRTLPSDCQYITEMFAKLDVHLKAISDSSVNAILELQTLVLIKFHHAYIFIRPHVKRFGVLSNIRKEFGFILGTL